MFGFLRGSRPSEPTFERILADASDLRESVLRKLERLPCRERIDVLCFIQELARQMERRYAVPPETLPFGSLHELSFEQASLLVEELDRLFSEAEQDRNEAASLAAAYCQSMALVCVAGSLAENREHKIEYINMKHQFGSQTGLFMDSLERA